MSYALYSINIICASMYSPLDPQDKRQNVLNVVSHQINPHNAAVDK